MLQAKLYKIDISLALKTIKPKSVIRFPLSFVFVSSSLQRSCEGIAGYGETRTAAR